MAFDFNAPAASAFNAGLESPIRNAMVRDVCSRWDEPDAFWPLLSDYNESTAGGRIWTPSGSAAFIDSGFDDGAFNIAGVRLGGANALVPTDAIITTPHHADFDLSLASPWTIRFVMRFVSLGNVGLTGLFSSRILFKGDLANYGFHHGGFDNPSSGWSIEVLSSGLSTLIGPMEFRGGSATPIIAPFKIAPVGFANTAIHGHVVLTYDGVSKIKPWFNLMTFGDVDVTGKAITANTDPLYSSSRSQHDLFEPSPSHSHFHQILIGQLGFWDYAWDEQQVECDYANAYTWP